MTTLGELVGEHPTFGMYMLLHPDQRTDIYLTVRMAVIDNAAPRWGFAEWDVDNWAAAGGHWQWFDMTSLVRGLTWTRGAHGLSDRPEVGTCNFTLDWAGGYLDIVDNTIFPHPDFLRSGTLWQIAVTAGPPWVDPDSPWNALFTGYVETLSEHESAQWADGWIDVTLAETTSSLARLNSAAVVVRGAGDTLTERIKRVLGVDPPRTNPWPFDWGGVQTDDMAGFVRFQSTDLAQPRLSEIYRTVDTCHYDAYADRYGNITVWPHSVGFPLQAFIGPTVLDASLHPEPQTFDSTTVQIPYDCSNGFGFEKNSDDVANVVTAAATGGLVQTARDGASIALYGEISTGRNDLLMQDLGGHVQVWVDAELTARKNSVLHCGPVHLDAAMGSLVGEVIADITMHRTVPVYVPNRVPVSFEIGGYTMNLVPLDEHGNATWTADISLRPATQN